MEEEQEAETYLSYNGLNRVPMIWGIPYMFGLMTISFSLLIGMYLANVIGGIGWLLASLSVPILGYVKIICADDDQAIKILTLELKWSLIKFFSGNSKYHGDTLTIVPVSYGRKLKYVKQYFKKTV